MSEPRRGPFPPTLFLLGLVLQAVLHLVLPIAQLIPQGWRPLGAVLIVGGLAMEIVADGQFKRAETEINPFGTPSSFVTAGLFRYSRNPMYLGMIVILAGAALAYGSLSPWIVPPALGWTLTARFIRVEEAKLTALFGAEYRDYCKRVRRWL